MKLIQITTGIVLLFASCPVSFAFPSRRATTCTVKSSGGDDTPIIVEAFEKCNNGGVVEFPKSSTYNLQSALTLSLIHI